MIDVRYMLVGCSLVVAACSTPELDQRYTPLSGSVWVTGPVEGATVYCYELGADGSPGTVLGTSEPTGSDGRFHIDILPYRGPILLEAVGAGALYQEMATGSDANFDRTTRLRSVALGWDSAGGKLEVGIDYDTGKDDLILTPWSELAIEYAELRRDTHLAATWDSELTQSVLIWAEFLDYDFWSVEPQSLAAGPVGAFQEREHAGLLLAGLSNLSSRIALASGVTSSDISSLSVVKKLSDDLKGDARLLLDGEPGPIAIGSCGAAAKRTCTLSGSFLRAELALSAGYFLDDDTANRSGLSYGGEIKTLLDDHITKHNSELFPPYQGESFDTDAPAITVEGVQDSDVVSGTLRVTITVTDGIEMGTIDSVALEREGAMLDDALLERGELMAPSTKTRVQEVAIDTTGVADGTLTLVITASDRAVNEATLSIEVTSNNSGTGLIAGDVFVGGRVAGAEVSAYDMSNGVMGALLGVAVTDEAGHFAVEIAESPQTTSILLQARKPEGTALASYTEMVVDQEVLLSDDDVIESVITAWVDGGVRNVMVTPLTHMATAYARGLFQYASSSIPELWDEAVDTAFAALQKHVTDGASPIVFRSVRPADLTVAAEVGSLTSQSRYGLLIAGLGEVARDHATRSFATAATMNTLTLTQRLAADLEVSASGVPLWDGVALATLTHGQVEGTSYWTRLDLALGIVRFLKENDRNASPFLESEVLPLLDAIAEDDGQYALLGVSLYPVAEEPIAYDLIAPMAQLVTPTPAEGAVLRGIINLAATASDNRSLQPGVNPDGTRKGFYWLAPTSPEAVAASALDDGATIAGPWLLTGTLDLEAFPEGELVVSARAVDKAAKTGDAVLTLVVDKTAPSVVITGATAGGAALAEGGWTGASAVAVSGMATDAHAVIAQYRWNGGAWTALAVSSGAFSLASLPLQNNANTLELRATDPAGNVGSTSVTYYRDATPPTIVAATGASAGRIYQETEAGCTTITSPTSVTYGCDTTVPHPVTNPVSYTKFVTTYQSLALGGDNLPEWRYTATDNRTSATGITFEYRIRFGATTVVDWSPTPHMGASGYNRAVLVHGGLSSHLLEHDGSYTIDARARDEYGNASAVLTQTWTQTLRAPPIYFAPASAAQYNTDSYKTPAAFHLAGNFEAFVTAPAIRYIGWQVANPHDIPVHVRLNDLVTTATWRRTLQYRTTQTSDPSNILDTCPNPPDVGLRNQDVPSGCFTEATFGASWNYSDGSGWTQVSPSATATLSTGAVEAVVWNGTTGTALAPCTAPGCTANEYVIPAHATIVLFGLSSWSFLGITGYTAYSAIGAYGNLYAKTGASDDFRDCVAQQFVQTGWENDGDVMIPVGYYRCTDQRLMRRFWHVIAAEVSLSGLGATTIQTRLSPSATFQPIAGATPLAPAPGTGPTTGNRQQTWTSSYY